MILGAELQPKMVRDYTASLWLQSNRSIFCRGMNKINGLFIEGADLFTIGPRPTCLSMLLSANVSIWQADKQS